MPTARELLEQVDALMRRNRALEAAAGANELPVLTEAVAPGEGLRQAMATPSDDALPPDYSQALDYTQSQDETSSADDIPVLTEIVAELVPAQVEPVVVSMAEPVGTAADRAHWQELANEVQMQVLQCIDIFTDTAMRDQLAAKLEPVVDRASADFVATITKEIGQLLRHYVDEAVEREIERLRGDRQ